MTNDDEFWNIPDPSAKWASIDAEFAATDSPWTAPAEDQPDAEPVAESFPLFEAALEEAREGSTKRWWQR